jgi:hypothetical protein
MKTLSFIILLLFVFTFLSAATWNVVLTDLMYGWEGGSLDVKVNGVNVLTNITLPSGTGPLFFPFTVHHGDRITTIYTPGSFSYENCYSFQNQAGVTVLTNGAGTTVPTSIIDPFMAAVLNSYLYQIGYGANTGLLPVYPYYTYTYSQSLYLSSELPTTLGSKRISKIKYYWNGAASASHTLNWTIYIGHTSRTQFTSYTDWVPLSELTEVFTGNVHLLEFSGWVEITLDRPFDYNGTSNLVVAVDENTSLYDSSAGRFYQSTVSGNRSLVYYSDPTNPNPASPPTAMYMQASIPDIVFQMDCVAYPPSGESFPDPVIPLAWAQYRSHTISSDRWIISNSSIAGGEPCEMRASWTSYTGVSRLISPPIKTTGVSILYVSFDHYFDDYYTGVTAKLQYSHDMNTWTDTGWSFTSGGGDVSGPVSISIDPGTANFTYLAWTLEGNHYYFDYWYVDNVQVNIPALDARPIVIETEAVHNQTFTPRAIVRNNSSQPLTFYVTFTIGNYTYNSTQLVSSLPAYSNQTVDFAPYTPYLHSSSPIRVTTHLIGDTAPTNDQLEGNFVCLNLDRLAFVDAHHYSDTGLKGPTSFNLKTPGAVTHLGSPSSAGLFMAGADWIGNRWYASEYDSGSLTTDNFWWINHLNGVQTLIGESGTSLHGIAWDPNHEILYGTDTENLYTVDPATGAATLVGSHGGGLSFMIGIAYNDYTDILYGVDLETDALYTIDTNTGLATLIGPLGIYINYGQDLAFDRNTGQLFLAGYNYGSDYGPRLYWINQSTGEALKIGNFPVDYQMVGFAIPSGVAIADLRIEPDRTLNWDPIPGVSEYKIYGSDNPYSCFSYLGSTPSTSWIEPGNPQEMRFYMITAVYARSEEAPPIRYVTEYKDPLTGELLDPQPEIPVQESHQLPEISSETPSVGATRE